MFYFTFLCVLLNCEDFVDIFAVECVAIGKL